MDGGTVGMGAGAVVTEGEDGGNDPMRAGDELSELNAAVKNARDSASLERALNQISNLLTRQKQQREQREKRAAENAQSESSESAKKP